MNCLRCKEPMFRAKGDCGDEHYVCIPCKVEYCTKFNEEEQLGNDPLGRKYFWQDEDREKTEKKPRKQMRDAEKRKKQREEREKNRIKLYEQIILEASGLMGDYMYEYAEGNYSDQGGAEGMTAGSFSLSDDEIRDCMFESLSVIDNHGIKEKSLHKTFDFDGLKIDREKVVDYWFKKDYK